MATRKTRQKRKAKRRESVERSIKETRVILRRQSDIKRKIRKILEPEKIMPSELLNQPDWYDKMYTLCLIVGILLVLTLLISMAS